MTTALRKGRSHAGANSGRSPLAELVRRHDSDRYRTALFAPSVRREALFALYAFNYEVARIREGVTQSMLGQIRLQWWREVIEAAYAGKPPRHHPVVEPLAAMIAEFAPSRMHFDRLIDAREFDLADEPPATLAALEDYAEATSSGLICLALEVLGAGTPPAMAVGRGVGIAYALIGLIRAMPLHARGGRCYIPQDIAIDAELDRADYAALRPSPALRDAVGLIADHAASHLENARRHRRSVPRAALPGLLPAIIAERALTRLRRADFNPFDPAIAAPDPMLAWWLLFAVLRSRY